MYASLNPSHFTAGQFTQQMVEALERGEKVTPSLCYNAFEQVVFALFPELEEYQQCLFAAGATGVHLVGAGPTLFTLVEDKAQGERICSQLGGEVYLTQTL
jgi:4-diphosphocytidyl-2-C-methyl-D-erythritol kinase